MSIACETEVGEWIYCPLFSGQELEEWIEAIEKFFHQFQVPQIQYANLASHHLQVFSTNVKEYEDSTDFWNWSQFKKALRDEFNPVSTEESRDLSVIISDENKRNYVEFDQGSAPTGTNIKGLETAEIIVSSCLFDNIGSEVHTLEELFWHAIPMSLEKKGGPGSCAQKSTRKTTTTDKGANDTEGIVCSSKYSVDFYASNGVTLWQIAWGVFTGILHWPPDSEGIKLQILCAVKEKELMFSHGYELLWFIQRLLLLGNHSYKVLMMVDFTMCFNPSITTHLLGTSEALPVGVLECVVHKFLFFQIAVNKFSLHYTIVQCWFREQSGELVVSLMKYLSLQVSVPIPSTTMKFLRECTQGGKEIIFTRKILLLGTVAKEYWLRNIDKGLVMLAPSPGLAQVLFGLCINPTHFHSNLMLPSKGIPQKNSKDMKFIRECMSASKSLVSWELLWSKIISYTMLFPTPSVIVLPALIRKTLEWSMLYHAHISLYNLMLGQFTMEFQGYVNAVLQFKGATLWKIVWKGSSPYHSGYFRSLTQFNTISQF